MWMIRFIQYPRNSVENLNRSLYIKLLKTQWLSGRKLIPFPAGKGRWKFPKTTRNEIKFKHGTFQIFIFFFFVFVYCLFAFVLILFSLLINFYPKTSWTKNSSRLALCANSLQNFWDVERIESLHTSVMYVSCFTTLAQMGIVKCQANFLWMTRL